MPTLPGERYAFCARLREPEPNQLTEANIQRLWFEEAYRNPLVTTSGETIQILQPGFWNKTAGPDFSHASLLNGQGEKEVGSIEIHLHPPAWNQHGHHHDPAYHNVILHVVWQLGPRSFFPATHQNRALRQTELSTQLRTPLHQLSPLLSAQPDELSTGVRPGRCHQTLAHLPTPQVLDILREAGSFRFHTKVRTFQTRAHVLGPDQALWLGLADAMGYAENRQPFQLLARRLPIDQLRPLPQPEQQALLYGLAGFLPHRLIDLPDPRGRHWLRALWDIWWKQRDSLADEILPLHLWTRTGVRPANRPERRLAALASLIPSWPAFTRALPHPADPATETILTNLLHPFWSHHLGWRSTTRPAPVALLGRERIERLLFNTLWPAAYSHAPAAVQNLLASRKASGLNRSVRRAAVRLLSPSFPKVHLRELLVQEGLIQIFQDFCLHDTDHCAQCDFPTFLQNWPAS